MFGEFFYYGGRLFAFQGVYEVSDELKKMSEHHIALEPFWCHFFSHEYHVALVMLTLVRALEIPASYNKLMKISRSSTLEFASF